MASSYTLGEHFEDFVRRLLQSGRYASASEVMRDGLRLLEEREKTNEAKLEALRNSINEGLSSPIEKLDMAEIKDTAHRIRKSKAASKHGA